MDREGRGRGRLGKEEEKKGRKGGGREDRDEGKEKESIRKKEG